MNNDLFEFLSAFDDDDMPDGAWQAKIEDGVTFWNEDKKTNLDPFDTFMNYVEEVENRQSAKDYDSVSTGGSHREDT